MAIYAMQQISQPPDSRTYSAEVTGLRRNLLHHRRLRPSERLIILLQNPPSCQPFFRKLRQKISSKNAACFLPAFVLFSPLFFRPCLTKRVILFII